MAINEYITIQGVQDHPTLKIVQLKGELDESNIEELEKMLETLLADASPTRYVIFDLSQLTFMNSKVIGFMASFYTTVVKMGKKLFLAGANENINDILSLVGLIQMIGHYKTVEEAVAVCR